jgi:hypothetical protein
MLGTTIGSMVSFSKKLLLYWILGREVVEYYEDIFDFNGREIRRIFTDENAHIARAIDGSK